MKRQTITISLVGGFSLAAILITFVGGVIMLNMWYIVASGGIAAVCSVAEALSDIRKFLESKETQL